MIKLMDTRGEDLNDLQVSLLGFGSISLGVGGIAHHETVWAAYCIWAFSAVCLVVVLLPMALSYIKKKLNAIEPRAEPKKRQLIKFLPPRPDPPFTA